MNSNQENVLTEAIMETRLYVYGSHDIVIASRKGVCDTVKILIRLGADVNTQNYSGSTALMEAAQNGHIEVVKTLLEAKADVNIVDERDRTALMNAIKEGHIEIVKTLIEAGADVKLANDYGHTALINAALNDHTEIIKALIDAGADIDNTALMYATWRGHIEVVETLIKVGANINIQNNDGETALMEAVKKDHIGIVEILIKEGADINIQNNNAETALDIIDSEDHYISDENEPLMYELINLAEAVDLLLENIEADVTGLLNNKSKSVVAISRFKSILLKNGINENMYQTYLDKLSNNSTIPGEIKDQLTEIVCLAKKDFDMFCSIIFTEGLGVKIYSDPLMSILPEERKSSYMQTELSTEEKEKIIDFYAQQGCNFIDQLRKYFDKEEQLTEEELSFLKADIESANIEFLKNNCSELLSNSYFLANLISDLNKILLPKSLKDSLSPLLKEYEEQAQIFERIKAIQSYGETKYKEEKYEEAIEEYNKALARLDELNELGELDLVPYKDEFKFSLIFNRAKAYHKNQDFKNAIKDFQEFLKYDSPFHPRALLSLEKFLEKYPIQEMDNISNFEGLKIDVETECRQANIHYVYADHDQRNLLTYGNISIIGARNITFEGNIPIIGAQNITFEMLPDEMLPDSVP